MSPVITVAPTAAVMTSAPVREAPSCDELIREHLPLVGMLARETLRRVPSHIRFDDLVSAGSLALVQAAAAFDPSLQVPFDRFAVRRIRGAILDELRAVDWATRKVRRRARDIDAARARLRDALGREPTEAEVAEDLGVSVRVLAESAANIHRSVVLSMDSQPADDTDSLARALTDHSATPEDRLLRREQMRYLAAAITELPERHRAVVEGHYFAGRPMSDMATEWGITSSRVSQLRTEAVEMIRGALRYAEHDGRSDFMKRVARPDGAVARRRLAYYDAVQERFAGGPAATLATSA